MCVRVCKTSSSEDERYKNLSSTRSSLFKVSIIHNQHLHPSIPTMNNLAHSPFGVPHGKCSLNNESRLQALRGFLDLASIVDRFPQTSRASKAGNIYGTLHPSCDLYEDPSGAIPSLSSSNELAHMHPFRATSSSLVRALGENWMDHPLSLPSSPVSYHGSLSPPLFSVNGGKPDVTPIRPPLPLTKK